MAPLQNAAVAFKRIGILGVWIGTIGLFFICTPPLYDFDITHNYSRTKFSGRDLSNRLIGISPLLTQSGAIFGRKFPSISIIEMIRKEKKELEVIGADSVHNVLSRQLPSERLDNFYQLLYSGKIVTLQNEDTIWNAMNTDYLLALRVRHGMDIRTFNQMMRKKVRLEAELWDCVAKETAWRVTIVGTCNRHGVSDQQFLIEAIRKVIIALPPMLPAYDKKAW